MSNWKFHQIGKKPKLNKPIFIEGLPGIGNVGKVAIDFIIDELKSSKLYEITSYNFPHSVFVNEDNLVELPQIEIFYKKFNGSRPDLILMGGDVQPVDEISSYEFSDKILDLIQSYKSNELITLGGIGLASVPKKPQVYCTGNSKKILKKYKHKLVNDKLYGVVGPIVGVSGLLLGLAKQRKMDAISFLAETYGHPMYLGIKGAREILNVLNNKLNLKLNTKKFDREIKDVEAEILKKTDQLSEVTRKTALNKLKSKLGQEVDYIG